MCDQAPVKGHIGTDDEVDKKFTLGLLMYDNVTVLDFAGPFEVFTIAGEMYDTKFKVVTLSENKYVRALNGLNVVVDHIIGDEEMPALNIILTPGSTVSGTQAALDNPTYVNWINAVEPAQDYIISVCTGVNFLGRAGLVDDLDITTHHQAFDLAEKECPNSRIHRDRRFTDNGRVLTSAGISAGIDVSLYFVKRILGRDAAIAVAERMEYLWKDLSYDKVLGVIEGIGFTPV